MFFSHFGDVFSHFGDVFSHFGDVFSHFDDVFSHFGDVFSHFGNVFSHFGDVFSHLGDVFSHFGDVFSHFGDVFSHFGDVSSHQVVFEHAGSRKIVFSCFHPDVCSMLRLKQNRYPTLFLSQGKSTKYLHYDDLRTQSTKQAIEFAKSADILVSIQ